LAVTAAAASAQPARTDLAGFRKTMEPFYTSMVAVACPSSPTWARNGLGNTTPLLFPMFRIAISTIILQLQQC
jgi:hypothetical protein